MLLIINSNVIQQLEGERDAVLALYHHKVAKDTRHIDCIVISEEKASRREFGE